MIQRATKITIPNYYLKHRKIIPMTIDNGTEKEHFEDIIFKCRNSCWIGVQMFSLFGYLDVRTVEMY